MKNKKNSKLLTNEHLLKDLPNSFSLADAAIQIAYRKLETGGEFDLQKVLNEVVKTHESQVVISETEKSE
ncbi:MAG: hypothetical protein SP4CHLAM5_00860 [Chlamydiia bacterium]|nr:hypothetical protein [Chlamydiia bacterium]MCH9617963.1 hypothetical protein [Chlamydiia bacterium]MCH9623712.1 hypothetical protein [Chlamydiia bacterium]